MWPKDTCNWTTEVASSAAVCCWEHILLFQESPVLYLISSVTLATYEPLSDSFSMYAYSCMSPYSCINWEQHHLCTEFVRYGWISQQSVSYFGESLTHLYFMWKKNNHPLDFRWVISLQLMSCTQVVYISSSLIVFIISMTHPFRNLFCISGSILCSHLIFKKCDVDPTLLLLAAEG